MRRLLDDRGTSTLEFIVVLPTLLVLMFGIVEMSRAWLTLNVVTTAAREGARAAVVAPAGSFQSVGVARINQVLTSANLACGTTPCTVTCSTNPCAADSTVVATVDVTFQTMVPALLPMLGSITIADTASMRFEGGS